MSATITYVPRVASSSETARPNPDAPPVTIAMAGFCMINSKRIEDGELAHKLYRVFGWQSRCECHGLVNNRDWQYQPLPLLRNRLHGRTNPE